MISVASFWVSNKCSGDSFWSYCSINKVLQLFDGFDVSNVGMVLIDVCILYYHNSIIILSHSVSLSLILPNYDSSPL